MQKVLVLVDLIAHVLADKETSVVRVAHHRACLVLSINLVHSGT